MVCEVGSLNKPIYPGTAIGEWEMLMNSDWRKPSHRPERGREINPLARDEFEPVHKFNLRN